jgi:hypothetical protein
MRPRSFGSFGLDPAVRPSPMYAAHSAKWSITSQSVRSDRANARAALRCRAPLVAGNRGLLALGGHGACPTRGRDKSPAGLPVRFTYRIMARRLKSESGNLSQRSRIERQPRLLVSLAQWASPGSFADPLQACQARHTGGEAVPPPRASLLASIGRRPPLWNIEETPCRR